MGKISISTTDEVIYHLESIHRYFEGREIDIFELAVSLLTILRDANIAGNQIALVEKDENGGIKAIHPIRIE